MERCCEFMATRVIKPRGPSRVQESLLAPPTADGSPTRRVRVWFGWRLIFDYLADPEVAQRYEAAMRRRCAGLRITNEPTTFNRDRAGS